MKIEAETVNRIIRDWFWEEVQDKLSIEDKDELERRITELFEGVKIKNE
tara:strand:- start:1213 stop:1359 length:147 start_codon:yes stop_codon:yes gene_type:complete